MTESGIVPLEISRQQCHRCQQKIQLSRSSYTVGYIIINLTCKTCQETRWGSYNFKRTGSLTDLEKDLIGIEVKDLGLTVPEDLLEISPAKNDLRQAIPVSPPLPIEKAPVPPSPEGPSQGLGSTADTAPLPLPTVVNERRMGLVKETLQEIESPKVLLGDVIRSIVNFESLDSKLEEPPKEAFWDPNNPEKPLNNFGLLVTGDSGSGKSQLLRAVISELSRQKVSICIFDFKNDYSDTQFLSQTNLKVYDLNRDGLPFNPLQLIPNEDGECQPIRQIHEFAAILRRIFNLGDQQEARLKRALATLYENNGIDPRAVHQFTSLRFKKIPFFSKIYDLLKEDPEATSRINAENETLLNRLSYLLDLNLFPNSDNTKTTFEQLIQDRVSLDFHKLPDDRVKAVLAEFLIVRLHNYVVKHSQPRKLRNLLVFDEAWRVKESERLQELAREGRAFGIGLAIGTQYPGDLPESLSGSLATQLFLHNREPDHQKHIARNLCGSTTNNAAATITELVSKLQKHEGLLKNQQYTPCSLIKTIPHYKRT